MGWVRNFLLLCVHYIPLLILFSIGGGKSQGFPPNETLVCVDFPVFGWLRCFCLDILEYLKGVLSQKRQSSVYHYKS